MAIHITNAVDDFDMVFMTEQSIAQQIPTLITDNPKYTISFVFRRYKINPDNSIEFADEPAHTFYIEDFYQIAVNDYTNGNMALTEALIANTEGIARIITLETDLIVEVQ